MLIVLYNFRETYPFHRILKCSKLVPLKVLCFICFYLPADFQRDVNAYHKDKTKKKVCWGGGGGDDTKLEKKIKQEEENIQN